jgi:hypothetical protein
LFERFASYLLLSNSACGRYAEEEDPKEVMRFGAWDFFGERALLANSKTLQTASAVVGAVQVESR